MTEELKVPDALELRAELESLGQQRSGVEELLKGASSAIAGANLQALFKQVVHVRLKPYRDALRTNRNPGT